MKKIFLRSFMLVVLFMLLKPPKSAAQPYCPMWLHNNANLVGLANDYVWGTLTEGTYWATVINSDPNTGDIICMSLPDQQIQVTKSQTMNTTFPGASAIVKGIILDFTGHPCGSLPNLQLNGTSVILRAQLGGNIILQVDYTNNNPDFCDYTIVPVTWGPFSASLVSGPTRVKLDWSTYTEQDVSHFSVEKSLDGANWYKIGQVTAVGNSTAQNFYTFYDNYPNSRGYYRVVSVDLDCKKMYTLIRVVNCSTCGTTWQNPYVAPDCAAPQPYISGLTANCSFLTKAYRLIGLPGTSQITWSFSNPSVASITQAGRICAVIPTGQGGMGTLTATAVKNGVTTYYSINIVFGIPPIYAWGSTTLPTNCEMGQFTATVSMLPGTSAGEYYWYQSGSYIGTGSQRQWTLSYVGQVINYEVRWYGPCGISSYFGSSNGMEPWKAATPTNTYELVRNPARATISITRRPPPCWEPPGPVEPNPWKSASPKASAGNTETVTIKVFDIQGNLKKATRVSATDTKIEINAGDLPTGVYFIHITDGKKEEKLKVMVQK